MPADIYLRASDLCIGWVYPNVRGQRVAVCVLPKPWRGVAESQKSTPLVSPAVLAARMSVSTANVALYYCFQGEVLTSACAAGGDSETVDAAKALFHELHGYATSESKRPDRRRPRRTDDEEPPDEESGDALAVRRLFVSSHKPKDPLPVSSNLDQAAPRGNDLQAALIRLLTRAKPREWLKALSFQTDPIFRESVAEHYVRELHKVALKMRRGYLERRERLQSPRGRVVASSVGRSEATQEPSIVCEFNDFERDLPLHRVLASALSIAIGVLGETDDRDESALDCAYGVRRIQEGIAVYPRPMARGSAERLRLPASLRQTWQTPLDLARAVLAERSPTGAETDPDDTPDLTVPSASLWERIIVATLIAGGFHTIGEPDEADSEEDDQPLSAGSRRIAPPWKLKNAGCFRCDIVVRRKQAADLILDAKYTTLYPYKDRERIIPVAHTRQVFAYGVLWHAQRPYHSPNEPTNEGHTDVGLVYVMRPGNEDEVGWLLREKHPIDPTHIPGPSLFVLEMGFPAAINCASASQLEQFHKSMGQKWRSILGSDSGADN